MHPHTLLNNARDLAWWLVPAATLFVIVGLEVRTLRHPAAAAAPESVPAVAKAVDAVPAVLPEYGITGSLESHQETVERPLFVPTRRPAPTPTQEVPKPTMPKGQFALTGTTVVDGKGTAFLREVKGGKFRRVQQGDTINGMRVSEVNHDRVKFVMGDESEELTLKVAVNPKPTPGIPVAPPGPPTAIAGGAAAGQPPQTPQQAAQTLIERRRAARAAAAQGQSAPPPPAQGNPQGTNGLAGRRSAAAAAQREAARDAPAATPGAAGGTWGDVFKQYQERAGTPPGR
ncbi:MAG: hypothetical protein ABI920_06600 [Casimicrobiaceae bacterium]